MNKEYRTKKTPKSDKDAYAQIAVRRRALWSVQPIHDAIMTAASDPHLMPRLRPVSGGMI